MSVVAVRRRLFLCVVIGVLVALSLSVWAEGEADQIARARQLIAEKKYDDAITVLTPIISSSDRVNSRLARETLVECYRFVGQFRKAISLLESLRLDYPEDMATWAVRIGMCQREDERVSEALATLKVALNYLSRPAAITRALAENLYCCYDLNHKWEDGVALCQSVLEKEPQNTVEWTFLLGRCYQRAGEDAKAATTFEKVLEWVKGDAADVRRVEPWLFGAYQETGEFEKGEALLARLEEDYPAYHAHWQAELGGYHKRQARRILYGAYDLQGKGDYEEAIAAYKKVIESYPKFKNLAESAHVCIVECLYSQRKPDEATDYAKKLYDEQPEMRGTALFAQGLLTFFSKDYDGSTALFRRVMSEYPKDRHASLAKSFLVSALTKVGRFDEAVEVLGVGSDPERKAEELNPDLKARNLLQIAAIYQEAKRYREAIKAFKEVRSLKDAPEEMKAEATYRSGLCYREINYPSSAQRCMKDVTKLYPDSHWAREAMTLLYLWPD